MYNETSWHPKPGNFGWVSPYGLSYNEASMKDAHKREAAAANGFDFTVIWADEKIDYALIKGKMMKSIKITLKQLFEFLGADNIKLDEFQQVTDEIAVKTPTGEFTPLLGVIRKTDNKVRVTTKTGKQIVCGEKHFFINADGNHIYCKDATEIQTTSGLDYIVSKESVGYGEVYDIAVATPHLYATPNGVIHHNTTFIKHLIHRSGSSAKVTYDERIMSGDSLFANFIDGEEQFLIMEDADAFIGARKDGNTMMHRFLNVSDGLISSKGKKLIFSTNLPNVGDIDNALLRPGRCFDVVTFRALTRDEAQGVYSEIKSDTVLDSGSSFTLAELFEKQPTGNSTSHGKVGFF